MWLWPPFRLAGRGQGPTRARPEARGPDRRSWRRLLRHLQLRVLGQQHRQRQDHELQGGHLRRQRQRQDNHVRGARPAQVQVGPRGGCLDSESHLSRVSFIFCDTV